MKLFCLCLALAVLPSGAQTGASLAPIALYTQYQKDIPPAVMSALRAEVESIMAPIGLKFEWRELSGNDHAPASVELAVVNFKGLCSLEGVTAHKVLIGPLGWTHISDGTILPFADVDCDAVHALLQKDIAFIPHVERLAVFGRALGRVMAHELYHIFANTTHHGADGVGREAYSVQDLLSTDFHFEARESNALKAGPAHAALLTAAANSTPDDAEPVNRRQ